VLEFTDLSRFVYLVVYALLGRASVSFLFAPLLGKLHGRQHRSDLLCEFGVFVGGYVSLGSALVSMFGLVVLGCVFQHVCACVYVVVAGWSTGCGDQEGIAVC
jgi:hypothetical protein